MQVFTTRVVDLLKVHSTLTEFFQRKKKKFYKNHVKDHSTSFYIRSTEGIDFLVEYSTLFLLKKKIQSS